MAMCPHHGSAAEVEGRHDAMTIVTAKQLSGCLERSLGEHGLPELCNGKALLPKGFLEAQRAVQQDQLQHLQAHSVVNAELQQASCPARSLHPPLASELLCKAAGTLSESY